MLNLLSRGAIVISCRLDDADWPTASDGLRPLPTAEQTGTFDPLLPLRFALPTTATPRKRPLSHGSSMGAFGQDQTVGVTRQFAAKQP